MSHTLAMGQQVENSEVNVHVLIGRLVSEVDTEAVDAAVELGYIAITALGPAATTAIEDLLEHASSDPDASVRAVSLHSLAELQAPVSQALPVAVASLRNPDPGVRNSARHLLGRLGKDAQSTAPMLREILRRGDSLVRIVSAWALVHVEPTPEIFEEATPLLLTGLQNSDPHIRTEAALTLGGSCTTSKEVLLTLECAKNDADEKVKTAATSALAKLRPVP